MISSLIFTVAFILFQAVIPYKPQDEFYIKLDYHFQPRPFSDFNTVQLRGESVFDRNAGHTVLPYLIVYIKVLKVPGEKARVSITNNLSSRPMNKKVAAGSVLELDLGFTDDMVDRVRPHEYVLSFLDENRNPVDRIVLFVERDGTFLVNGEERGKF